jgi:hypothetical protein
VKHIELEEAGIIEPMPHKHHSGANAPLRVTHKHAKPFELLNANINSHKRQGEIILYFTLGSLKQYNEIVFLRKHVRVARVANAFPAFYRTRRFLAVLTGARHWNLSRVN